jgi:hypothetical protein
MINTAAIYANFDGIPTNLLVIPAILHVIPANFRIIPAIFHVIPAQAGISARYRDDKIPAYAGMTV